MDRFERRGDFIIANDLDTAFSISIIGLIGVDNNFLHIKLDFYKSSKNVKIEFSSEDEAKEAYLNLIGCLY